MPISTNGTIITRVAGALYGEYMSNASYNEIALVSTIAPATVAANFLTSDFAGRTDAQLATTVLTNLGLNSIAGLNNWLAAQMTAAGSTATLKGAKLVELLNSFSMMTSDATYGSFATTFNNNVNAALTYSQTPGAAGGNFTTAGATAAAAAAAIAAAPVVFPLTNGSDVRTTGAGNDTFNALWSSTTGMTFATNDILDGGAGNDTLFIQVGATGVHGPATLSNIETITTNFSAAATVNLLGATGVTTIESNGSSADAAFTNIGSATTALRVANTANSANFGFTAGAVAGSADTANVALNVVTGGTLTLTSGFETLSLTSSGSANTLTGLSLGTASASTVRVLGDQALNIGTVATAVTLPTTVTNFDASGNTASGAGVVATFGATTVSTSISGGTGNDTFNITNISGTVNVAGGAGNDTFIESSTLRTTDTISGGDGTADVLITSAESAQAYSAPSTRTITGIERLQLQTPGSTGVTLTTANVDTGINTVTLGAGTATVASGIGAAAAAFTATSGTYGITGPAGTLAVNLGGTLGGTLTLTDTGTAITDSATVTVSQSTATNNVLAGQNISSVGYETLTISSGSTVTAAQTLGTVGVTVDTGGASVVNFTGVNNLSVGAITAVTVSASGMTGASTFTQTAAAGSTTTSITGTGNNDVILGGSAASTLTGNAGNDTITGGAGNDSISGGDGADQITGGLGRDTMTGGSGADTFVFGQNVAGSIVSSAAASDQITDFTSGTDKLSILNNVSGTATAISSFTGNFANITLALAATNGGAANQAVFVTSENNLYVIAATNGTLTQATDTVINLPGVTSLTSADLLLGAQGTGTTISLTAAAANLSNSASTNATAVTTALDDALSSTAAFLVSSTIDGGVGNDTLTISTAPGTFTLASAGTAGATVTNVENITLSAGSTNTVTMPATAGLTVTNGSSTANSTVALANAARQSFTTASTASGVNTVTLGAAAQSVTGGAGADIINASNAQALGSTFTGGGGSDTLNITGAAITNTFGSTAVAGANTAISSIETINVVGGSAVTITPDVALTIGIDNTNAASSIVGTGSTITVSHAAAAYQTTLSGTSAYSVSGGTTGTVTHSAISGVTAGVVTLVTSANANTFVNNTATQDIANGAALGATLTLSGTGAGGFSVTGVGTAANAVVTEATTMTGPISITTASTNAVTITQASTASSHGAVTITQAGTGTVTLTALIADGASTTVTASGATGDLLGAAGSTAPLNYTATAGAHMIHLGAGTTAVNDTIVASTGNDTIIGGLGADLITITSGGTDRINLIASHTAAPAGFTATAAVPTTAIFVGGSDVITGFGVGDSIGLGSAIDATTGAITALTLTAASTLIRNGGTLGATTAGDVVLLTGTYTAATGFFTPTVSGTDSLLVFDGNGTTDAGTTYRSVVLVGYVDTGTADAVATGVFTGA